MRLQIVAVGRMKSGPETELFARYEDRASKAGRQLGLSAVSRREFAESRLPRAQARRDEEASALLGALSPGAVAIALDERGEDIDSAAFAALLRSHLDGGTSELAFLIGGPDGHGEAALTVARKTIRFGRLTWPHQIVRILLAEQIYRAITILTGHPYHRE
ncbi:MAG TPA: 23S rRNA (pseudouridine(1915)-N(3))-methyltransferase RlmH [Rhizobiaceae bacterium]|nr:23S rRNA (pseudouridine(1915)-N(3))-methyltransferase RlmH [Rhizobiaceae bacterium]